MSTYTVTAERSGKWWVLQAVDAPGAITQVARLDQAGQIIEAISFVTGQAQETINIALRPILPAAAVEHMSVAAKLREEAAAANTAASIESRAAVAALKASGLTVRDIGSILGISFQRAHQLAS
jgi:hypothetical protein